MQGPAEMRKQACIAGKGAQMVALVPCRRAWDCGGMARWHEIRSAECETAANAEGHARRCAEVGKMDWWEGGG
jgi:hypothetical protein